MAERVGGVAYLFVDGTQHAVVGNFTYNLGSPKRESKLGPDGYHGYTEKAQASVIEGEVTDMRDTDVKTLTELTGATVTLELANGKTVVQRDATYVADGNVTTEMGNIQFRTEGPPAELLQ